MSYFNNNERKHNESTHRKINEYAQKLVFNISIDSLQKKIMKNRINGNFEYAMKNTQKFIDYCKNIKLI